MRERVTPGIMINGYRFTRKLGTGAFAAVWLATKYDQWFAVKVHNARRSIDDVADEVNFLSRFTGSPFVVNMVEHFNDGEDHFIVLERMGKDLYWLIKNYDQNNATLPPNLIKRITIQLAKCINAIHSHDIIHTDLKPENIMLPRIHAHRSFYMREKKYIRRFAAVAGREPHDGTFALLRELILTANVTGIKISDLGNCCYDSSKKKSFCIVTRHYRPPEVILQYPYNKRVDMWSLGCIVYEMISNNILFAPIKNNNMSVNSNHLALIIKTFGRLPRHLVTGSRYGHKYFDVEDRRKTFMFQYLIGKREPLCKVLYKYWSVDPDVAKYYEYMTQPLFEYDPNRRITAANYLNVILA